MLEPSGTEILRPLATRAFRLVESTFNETEATGCLSVVTGPSGIGKSFAAELLAREHPERSLICAPESTSPSALLSALITSMSGRWPKTNYLAFLWEDVVDLVRATPLVIIDASEDLHRSQLDALQHLRQELPNHFGLVLIGPPQFEIDLRDSLGLIADVEQWVNLPCLSAREVATFIPHAHEVWYDVSAQWLLELDAAWAQGLVQRWVTLTEAAVYALDEDPEMPADALAETLVREFDQR